MHYRPHPTAWVKPALLTSLGLLAATPALAQTAFLDSATRIQVWLPAPQTREQLQNRFQARLNGKPLALVSVEAMGEPERERLLPRTPGRVVLAGTFQPVLGGRAWDPDGEVTRMTEEKPGVFSLTVELPAGEFAYKVTRNGSWEENYGADFVPGGSNISLSIPGNNTLVKFLVDFNRRVILNSVVNPEQVPPPASLPPLPSRPSRLTPDRFPAALLTLAKPLRPEQVTDELLLLDRAGGNYRVIMREYLSDPAFYYGGSDLGSRWSPKQTAFKVWSPVARKAEVLLFTAPTGGTPRVIPMTRSREGVWATSVSGDLHGVYYQYRFHSYGEVRLTTDINCFAASPDSKRSLVVDLRRTDPPGWPVPAPGTYPRQTDTVVYELSVRDFTVHPTSGVKPEWRGKYAGLGQSGTRLPGTDFRTGLDYLADLGVTHIHLLPVHNFLTGSRDEYTWGYATNLFNVPEETYSATPDRPLTVIREFKQMVLSLHRAGLRVVLDVVYNHTWPPQGRDSAFWQTVPYYYFHTSDRGDLLNESGVGNSLNDSRPMVRKFVQDSLLYWLEEYRVDGFRFDLLGIHYPESVRRWAKALRSRRPDILLYGEPWTGGGPIRSGKGSQRGAGIAVFNDHFRGAFRGDTDGKSPGFALGGGGSPQALENAIAGSLDDFADSPEETINYVSAHDNLTLRDKIALALPGSPEALREAATRFAGAVTLLSQGVPFLEGGVEIGRTKGGNSNSYNAGDKVNGYDWERAAGFRRTYAYYRGLIRLRQAHRVFRLNSAGEIRQRLAFLPSTGLPADTVAFTLKGSQGDPHREYLVLFHGGKGRAAFRLPEGGWALLANGEVAGGKPLRQVEAELLLEPLSAYVLAR